MSTSYPIGTPGQPWGEAERAAWRAAQRKQRSHADEVVAPIEALAARFDVETYGRLDYDGQQFPLLALRSRGWRDELPTMLVTGGVHGYETSGVQGALQFLREHGEDWSSRANLLVVPCVSPWGYERIQRWNFDALDPNRNFFAGTKAAESAALLALLAPLQGRVLMHIDLHETTDTDESEFRPALAARDGKPFEPGEIPDGFYLVDDSERPQPGFQRAVIEAVAPVTHIAEPDAKGNIIDCPLQQHGVIAFAVSRSHLCAAMTGARFTTTTEVYPDSPRTSPAQCNAAQVAAVRAAIGYALAAVN
ncbi:M14 family metallocarboxypeptidase [Paucibacter sp. R3-3]|uniref:M14 family metallocarboxypeptidase n=1 Tax=Roseateles agri TaxID=3098619 RepID=A0ABU5DCB5_9BURK|nr:M14 family metallocarboxypeptidase [Paucibacter sp. R3-3]MDY0743905.1 M14 family metallocarboxypeptidase [Paucibacter sp. R3-3]